MKTVRVPVAVIVVVSVLIVVLILYLFNQNSKLTEGLVTNEQIKLENERLGLMANFSAAEQLENPEIREPIGFKLA